MNTSTYHTLLRQIQVTTAFTGRRFEKLLLALRDASYAGIAVVSILAIALCSAAMADGDRHQYDEKKEFDSAIKHYEAENYGKAREIWANSAAKGGVKSQYRLGEMYEYGVGVKKDLVEGHLWYSLAADAGSLRAERALFRIENLMSEEQIIRAQMLLAEFSPIFTAAKSNSDTPADAASTKDALVKNSSQQQPAQVASDAATGDSSSDAAIQQADPDSIDAELFTAIPTSTPEEIEKETKTSGTSSQQSLKQTGKVAESDFERRRLKLVNSSGPGPQIVNDAVQPTALSESTVQTEATKPVREVKVIKPDAVVSSEPVAQADSQTTATNSSIADTVDIEESVSNEAGSGEMVSDEAVAEEVLTESEELAHTATEKASVKSSGAKSSLKTVALRQPAAAESIANSNQAYSNKPVPTSQKLTATTVDLKKVGPVNQADQVNSPTEHRPVNGDGAEASNLRQLVDAPQAQMPQFALIDTDQSSPKPLLKQAAPSGITDAPGDRQGVQSIQQMLTQLGYKIDDESGQIGPQTRKAIQAFRRDSALLVSTLIDVDFLAALYKRHAAVTN